MTGAFVAPLAISAGFLLRLLRRLADIVIGGLLCISPVTAIVALGWITRRMGATHRGEPRPSWLLGPLGKGVVMRLLGGFAANIRAGLAALIGFGAWTLPFTLVWLGAWWAGWDNSFNKGYEQAWVGPSIFLLGTLVALTVLALLPFAAAHHAAEGRVSAFFDLRRILRHARGAGWRGTGLAVLSVGAAVPLFGLVALPVFVEEIVPGFSALLLQEQQKVAGGFLLAAAFWAFAALWALRHLAMRAYRREAKPGRLASVWLLLSAAVWAGLPVLILVGQFMNYAPHRWLIHPFYSLPWPG
jgi:hypothetical protein